MLAGGIHPLAPPPGRRLVQPAAIVIAADVVDVLPAVGLQGAKLSDHLFPLFVLRHHLAPRHITDVDGDVPRERRPAGVTSLLGGAQRVRETVPTFLEIGAHVGVPECPEAEPVSRHGNLPSMIRRTVLSPQP